MIQWNTRSKRREKHMNSAEETRWTCWNCDDLRTALCLPELRHHPGWLVAKRQYERSRELTTWKHWLILMSSPHKSLLAEKVLLRRWRYQSILTGHVCSSPSSCSALLQLLPWSSTGLAGAANYLTIHLYKAALSFHRKTSDSPVEQGQTGI